LGRFDFGAKLAVVAKDVALGISEAHRLGVPMHVIEKAADLWRQALSEGLGNEDFTKIATLVEKQGGGAARGRRDANS